MNNLRLRNTSWGIVMLAHVFFTHACPLWFCILSQVVTIATVLEATVAAEVEAINPRVADVICE